MCVARRVARGSLAPTWGLARGADATQVLTVAGDHLCDGVVDDFARSSRFDARPAALLAPTHRHLIARAALVVGTAKSATRDLEEQHVVIGIATQVGAHLGLQIAEQRHRLGAHREAQPVLDARGVGWRVGPVAHQTSGDSRLHFVRAAAFGPIEPRAFGV